MASVREPARKYCWCEKNPSMAATLTNIPKFRTLQKSAFQTPLGNPEDDEVKEESLAKSLELPSSSVTQIDPSNILTWGQQSTPSRQSNPSEYQRDYPPSVSEAEPELNSDETSSSFDLKSTTLPLRSIQANFNGNNDNVYHTTRSKSKVMDWLDQSATEPFEVRAHTFRLLHNYRH